MAVPVQHTQHSLCSLQRTQRGLCSPQSTPNMVYVLSRAYPTQSMLSFPPMLFLWLVGKSCFAKK